MPSPRDEDRLARVVDARLRRSIRSQMESSPEVGPQVQLKLQRQAVVAVVVAVIKPRPHQVPRAGDGGERVAVAHAGWEAPQGVETLGQQQAHQVAVVHGDVVVLAGVDVGAIGDVDDAGGAVLVSAEVGFQAAVDA